MPTPSEITRALGTTFPQVLPVPHENESRENCCHLIVMELRKRLSISQMQCSQTSRPASATTPAALRVCSTCFGQINHLVRTARCHGLAPLPGRYSIRSPCEAHDQGCSDSGLSVLSSRGACWAREAAKFQGMKLMICSHTQASNQPIATGVCHI